MKQHTPRAQVEQAYAMAHDNHLKVVEKPPGRWNVYRVTVARLVFLFRTTRPAELYRRVDRAIRADAPRPTPLQEPLQEAR